MGDSRWPAVAPDWQVGAGGGPAGAHGRAEQPPAAPHRRPQRAHRPGGRPESLSGQPRAGQRLLPAPRSGLPVGAVPLRRRPGQTWSLPSHDDVTATLRHLPRLTPVWLPTDAPWLTPSEKLWRGLRRDGLTAQCHADDWPHLRQQVNACLAQFAHGSPALLRSVGLVGDGHRAYALCRSA
jgi:hypothetical protein